MALLLAGLGWAGLGWAGLGWAVAAPLPVASASPPLVLAAWTRIEDGPATHFTSCILYRITCFRYLDINCHKKRMMNLQNSDF